MRRMTGLIAVLALTVSTSLYADPHKNESGKGRGDKSRHWGEHEREHRGKHAYEYEYEYDDDRGRGYDRDDYPSYFHRHGYTRLSIPPGHYPPPGECRVWYPDLPPGHQPPPGRCGHAVPPGAWLIRHPEAMPDHVHVYEPQRPEVLMVGEFEIGSGAFVRVVMH
jgi:hypothetical protein